MKPAAKRQDIPVSQQTVTTHRISRESQINIEDDAIAVEEPLEIRLGFWDGEKFTHRAISITMRTPGDDFELAAGFLFTEGILQSAGQVKSIKHCGKMDAPQNTVRIELVENVTVNLKKLERHFYTTSSCGVCGKSSIEALATGAKSLANNNSLKISASNIHSLSSKLSESQTVFAETGGLHAAGLFNVNGELVDLREDVGRHNAVDKLIGQQFLKGNLPLNNKVLFISGRASFELVQKAVMAQIAIVCAVGAPSSLAVKAAEEFNITLIGFVRDGRFNIYTGAGRLEI